MGLEVNEKDRQSLTFTAQRILFSAPAGQRPA